MGTITSGVGLVSGINTSQIIDQLMQLESKPKTTLQTRIDSTNQQKLALVDLSTQFAKLKLNATFLKKPSAFTTAKATSSNESVLTATTTGSPTPGSYQFQVARLVTTQQTISNGFANYNTSLVGAGTITVEQGGGDLTQSTPLSALKGATGDGVRRGQFRLTDKSGRSAVIDISSAVTLDDVVKKINTAVDVSVRATITGDGLKLTDLSGGTGNLVAQDVGGGTAAADLGINKSVATATMTGDAVNGLGRNTLLSQLNDGRGVRTAASADFRVTFGDSSTVDVDLSSARTVGDAIDAINNAATGKLRAEVGSDGHSLKLTDLTGSGGNFTVSALNGSKAATDLGIAGSANGTMDGQWVISTLNTVLLSSLSGGQGLSTYGSISIANRNGDPPVSVNLSSAKTVQDVLDLINNSGAGVTASLKGSGNGIQINDTTGGTGTLSIADEGASTIASSLGIAGSFSTGSAQGANLQRQWISENSLLSTYNGGKGVTLGVIKVTNSNGTSTNIDLTGASNQRLGDVIKAINAKNAGITASINANGDGLLLTDTAGGAGKLSVDDVSGTAAADLNIKGTTAVGGTTLDGTFEKTITVTATDTLATLQQKIQDLNFGVTSQIINDGTDGTPYRLSMTAKNTGTAGRVVIDMGSTSIAGQNLVDAQDAAVFVGGAGSAQPLLITASRNQIAGVINGVTIDLHAVSSSPVSLDVSRNVDDAATQMQQFADQFNTILDKVAELTKFDPSTGEKGILLGDSTIQRIQEQMYSALNSVMKQGGRFKVLADIGLKIGDGARLEFDEDKFRSAYGTDPDSVQKLFTYLETSKDANGKDVTTGKGLGYVLENAITRLIDPVDGVITQENKTLDSKTQGFQDRIDTLDKLLTQKRTRLENQFAQMESVLSQLQSQQSSLSQIKSITTSSTSSS